MASGAIVARILSQYSGKGTKEARRDIGKLTKSFDSMAKKSAKAFGLVAAASAALAIKIGTDSVKSALADQQSQALLAQSLRTTTGATKESIAAVEEYISKQQAAFGVLDDDLRPALARLTRATGSVEAAQTMLGLSLDVSAGTGKDLTAVTTALSRAALGNRTALTKLGVPLDKNTLKTGDLNDILETLGKTFAGAASAKADTFAGRLNRVQIGFKEAQETLGYALLPTLETFFKTLVEKIIPAIQEWTKENGAKVVASFKIAIKAVVGFGVVIFKTVNFLYKNRGVFTSIAAIIASMFVASKIMAFVTTIETLVKAYKAIRTAALAAAAAQAVATGGISLAAAAAGVAGFAATMITITVALNKANKVFNDTSKATDDLILNFGDASKIANEYEKALGLGDIALTKSANTTKKLTKEQKLQAAAAGVLAKLKQLGVKPTTELDPIQLEAARLNLVKQGVTAEQERLAKILANYEAQLRGNQAIQRYADLLGVISDTKVSTEEISVLSKKWGISTDAVMEYIAKIYVANSTAVDNTSLIELYKSWGLTEAAAKQYIDFAKKLNDEKLSAAEIEKLMGAWGLTRAQVLAYAELVKNGTAISPTWQSPGDLAATGWNNALNAFNAYMSVQGTTPVTKTPVVGTPGPKPTPISEGDRFDFSMSDFVNQYGYLGIPGMAKGGIVNSPTLAMIGEQGPEAVVPLSNFNSSGGMSVVVNVSGSVISESDLVQSIRNELLQIQGNGQIISRSVLAI